MENITVKIDGKSISVPKGSTVLDAARAAGVYIPT
ncbi:MAG TPA: Fe-S-binding domain-containing protein, partial [Armatimonadetes bacterium]|nr:Fe-S-binding domain-containing protein [Armatimonadota bacterium]